MQQRVNSCKAARKTVECICSTIFYGSSVRYVPPSGKGVAAEVLKTCMRLHCGRRHVNTMCKFPCSVYLLLHAASFDTPCKLALMLPTIHFRNE